MRRIGVLVVVGIVVAGLAGLVRVAFGVAVGIGEVVFGSALALAFRTGSGGAEGTADEQLHAVERSTHDGGDDRTGEPSEQGEDLGPAV